MNPFDPKRGRAGAAGATRPDLARRPTSPTPTAVSRSEEDDARSSSKYRAALEALFAKKEAAKADPASEPPPERSSVKMVTVPRREDDPRSAEREKRMAKLLASEGRSAVTKAADDFCAAGFDLPEQQEVLLKLLDHDADARVLWSLSALHRVVDLEPVQRRAVLDARLRRLEDDADDAEVRALAASLRKKLPRAGAGR